MEKNEEYAYNVPVLHYWWGKLLPAILMALLVSGCQPIVAESLVTNSGMDTTVTIASPNGNSNSEQILRAEDTMDLIVLTSMLNPFCDQDNPPPICECQYANHPTPPSINVIETTESTITIRWIDRAHDTVGFRLESKVGGEPHYEKVKGFTVSESSNASNEYSWTDRNLWPPGEKYRYKLTVNSNCKTSNAYVSTNTVAPPAPTAPELLSFSADKRSISLSFKDTSTNELGFSVWRCAGEDECVEIGDRTKMLRNSAAASLPIGETFNVVDNRVEPDTEYCYRIFSWNKGGQSNDKDCIRIKTKPLELPLAPSNLDAIYISENSITFTWNDNANNESGFILEWDRSFTKDRFRKIPSPDTESYTLTDLVSGVRYCTTVRAYNDDGQSPKSKPPLCVETLKSPQPSPQGFRELRFFNCHPRKYRVSIWIKSPVKPQWTKMGSLPPQYSSAGCPGNSSPLRIKLTANGWHFVRAVAEDKDGCDVRNAIEVGSCIALNDLPVFGSPQGSLLEYKIGVQ